jgi:hypothetical protein
VEHLEHLLEGVVKVERMQILCRGSGYTSSFDDGFGGGEEFARPTYSEQYASMNVPDAVSKGGDNEPSFFQKAKNRI